MATKKDRKKGKGAESKRDKRASRKDSRGSEDLRAALRAEPGVRLDDRDTRATPAFKGGKSAGKAAIEKAGPALAELQERLYAQGRDGTGPAVLLVLQGMDTAGKGGAVRHVVGEVDPQGVQLASFKTPTAEEKRHPFLWRIRRELPDPGMIGVFDRSHYEDVLIARVHSLAPYSTLKGRYRQINTFEESLRARKGIRLVKVMLHISPEEQKARLAERLERPDKHWKFNPGDVDERERWDAYREAYQIMLDKTSTPAAPWYVVPADRMWYARLAVQQLLLAELRDLDPQWPEATYDVKAQAARLAAT